CHPTGCGVRPRRGVHFRDLEGRWRTLPHLLAPNTLRSLEGREVNVLRWFRRRRLGEAARRRLLIALARAEERLVQTHVRNVLEVQEAVGGDLPLTAVLDLYLDAVDPGEPTASIVARRVLAGGVDGKARRARAHR